MTTPTDPATLSTAAQRIDDWLLNGPAQIRTGPHAGGVCGSFDADARPRYVYPEITGYYLQWLAWHSRRTGDRVALAARANAAQAWLGRWARSATPQTRVHIEGGDDDWRNRTLFTFDMAMAVRGIGAAVAEELIDADVDAIAALCALLETLVASDGAFDACLSSASGALPLRWSTQRGAFLAKAGAGLLRAAEVLAVPATLCEAASTTLEASFRAFIHAPHEELHPLLYAYEGALSTLPDPAVHARLHDLAAQFDTLCSAAQAMAYVPESRSGAGARRVDVTAQMVRVARLLGRAVGEPDRWDVTVLQQRLVDAVGPRGTLPFAFDQGDALNTWAAMFASQALHAMPPAPAATHDPLLV